MIRAYHRPATLAEALRLVARGVTPLAGATAVYTAQPARDLEVVDVTGLGLEGIAAGKQGIAIGATATLQAIADARALPGVPGALLRRAASALGSRALRHAITLGGNVVHAVFWADMPVALLALDAELEIRRAGAKARRVGVGDAFGARTPPWRGGLVTRVMIPVARGDYGFGYERFARTSADYALATACAVVRRDRGVLRDVRLVVGALQGRPVRVVAVERLLEGESPTTGVLDAAATALGETVRVAPSFRADAGYRRKLAVVLARRALAAAAARAAAEE